MFDNDKIKIIESLPDGDALLVIWIKLLTHAGKTNANGFILISEDIALTDEDMAIVFNRPLNTIRLALEVFKRYGMITLQDNAIRIKNWDVYQNVDGMSKIKQQNAERQRKFREKKKLELSAPKEESNVTVTLRNGTDIDIDKDKDIKNKPKKKTSNPKYEICDMNNAEYLLEKIRVNISDFKNPNLEKWANDFRLMRMIDERADNHIKYMIDWAQNDTFWKANILSPSKLRKQWDRLVLLAKEDHKKKQNTKTKGVDFDSLRRELENGKNGNTGSNQIGNGLLP